MPTPLKIACLGEVMIELIAESDGQARIDVAGDTYNSAVYLSRVCKPGELAVSYVTALGKDTFSKRIISQIEQFGIDTSHIELREDLMPGLYAIETDATGERSFSYWRGQSAAKTLFQEPCNLKLSSLMEFDILYISGISMAILPSETRNALIDFISEYRNAGGKLFFDSNYRPRLWDDIETARNVTMTMMSMADIALPSLDDEMALFGDDDENAVLDRLSNAGIANGVLKRGERGPVAIGQNTTDLMFDEVTNVVDTTAAGDSFNAGFIYHIAMGDGLEKAMLGGHALASKVIQGKGAIIDI